jgi:hypothetical protein
MHQLRRWISAAAERPRAPFVGAAVVACLVCIPGLWIGWIADDLTHRGYILAHLNKADAHGAWWNMFDARGSIPLFVYFGIQPWWTSPHLSVAFLRPLATVSHYLDYLLWPNSPALMHAHNVVLFALIAWVATKLYRRVMGPGIAMWIATFLYVTDDAHMTSTAWIASRNTLLTALFALLTLYAFDRARRDGSRAALWFAPLALFCAHACSEGALAIWAYLFAYMFWLDASISPRRWLSLLPLAAVSVGWVVLSSYLGYGVHGSGAYLDPRTNLWKFFEEMAVRLPDLARVQFGLTDEVGHQLTKQKLVSIQAIVLMLWLPCLILGISAAWKKPSTRFWLFGCVLALIPLCAVGSVSRLLFVAGLGAHGFIAELLATCFEQATEQTGGLRNAQRTAATLPLVAHALIALVAVPLGPRFWTDIDRTVHRALLSLPSGAALQKSTILVLNTPDFVLSSFVAVYRIQSGMPAPEMMHVLGVSQRAVHVKRIDQNSITLEPDGGYLADSTSILARRRDEPFTRGQVIALYGALVQVEEVTGDGRPQRIKVATTDADDPKMMWTTWDDRVKQYMQLRLPAVGQSMTIFPK